MHEIAVHVSYTLLKPPKSDTWDSEVQWSLNSINSIQFNLNSNLVKTRNLNPNFTNRNGFQAINCRILRNVRTLHTVINQNVMPTK